MNMLESLRNHSPKPSIAISGPLSAGGLKTMANLLRRSSSYMRVCNKDRSEFGQYCPSTSREKIIIWNCHLKTTMSPFWKRKNAILATFLALFYTYRSDRSPTLSEKPVSEIPIRFSIVKSRSDIGMSSPFFS